MLDSLRSKILDLLARNRVMTIATLRADGWPQATTVGFVSEGLTLYFLCSPQSQKAANLARDQRVSIAIDRDSPKLLAIEGLSMAARVAPATDAEKTRILALLPERFPEYGAMPPIDPAEVAVYRAEPEVISVLDYSKGFGHTDLVYMKELAPVG
jgi:uncharacterized protein YhbP (UPF0306 family)